MKNTGIRYEILVQAIFQEILKQEIADNIVVQHDVVLIGKSGITHQIDVYWTFTFAGIEYETIVQVKDWNKPIKQEQVLTFKSILEDLPNQPRGIIVTKKGTQSGAKKFAIANGIILFELKECPKPPPIPINVNGMVIAHLERKPEKDIQKVTLYDVNFSEFSYLGDIIWFKQQSERLGFEVVNNALNWCGEINDASKVNFYDEQKRILINLQSLRDEILEELKEEIKIEKFEQLEKNSIYIKKVTKIFPSATYVENPSIILPFIKIQGIFLELKIEKQEEYIYPSQFVGFTRFVLTNIQDGQAKHFLINEDY